MKKLLFLALGCLAAAASAQTYDVLIRGGKVFDGTGAPWRYADIAVKGDRIVAVGFIAAEATATSVVDATGLYVSPGFIDPHSHASNALAVKDQAGVRALIAQGITTAFVNPDGGGAIDIPAQASSITAAGPGVNVVPQIGHNSVRAAVMAYEDRAPTDAELERMKTLVRDAMEAGSFGFSSGPFYAPGMYSKTEEIIELAKVAARYGGFYSSHIRDDSDYTIGVVAAVDEVIRIAREAKLPGIVTHIKTAGPRVRGFSGEIIKHIEAARAEGVEIWADQYPYEASQSSLAAYLIPSWAQEGGNAAMRARLNDPSVRDRLRQGIQENFDRRGGARTLQIGSFGPDRSLEGRRLDAIAEERGVSPVDLVISLLNESPQGVGMVSFTVNEVDIDAFMRQPWTMTGSDGGAPVFGQGVPHPRAYGTYPRKIKTYALEKKVLTLEQTIYTGTGLPAVVLGVKDRGFIREGAFADLLVFDVNKVRDTATYRQPHGYAEGMVDVLVNGQFAIKDGAFLDARAGKVLRRNQQ